MPLDGGMIEQCKAIARRYEQKMRLDYELVRALKCGELMQKGMTTVDPELVQRRLHGTAY
jgi:hypothetical protein